jgi:hypothetical protein
MLNSFVLAGYVLVFSAVVLCRMHRGLTFGRLLD